MNEPKIRTSMSLKDFNPTAIYFDTNIFDQILKKNGLTKEDLDLLEKTVEKRKLSILLSVTTLEEFILALKESPSISIPGLKIIFALADCNHLVKPHNMIISESIIRYANGEGISEPFINLNDPQYKILKDNLLELKEINQENKALISELLTIKKETQDQVAKFTTSLRKINHLGEWKNFQLNLASSNFKITYKKFWDHLSPEVVEDFAKRAGVLEECRKRGIEGLLKIKTVRMAVGIHLSMVYVQMFEKRIPKSGDSRDAHHAIMAAASSNLFVTNDRTLKRLLERIPGINDFRILTFEELMKGIKMSLSL